MQDKSSGSNKYGPPLPTISISLTLLAEIIRSPSKVFTRLTSARQGRAGAKGAGPRMHAQQSVPETVPNHKKVQEYNILHNSFPAIFLWQN